MYCLPGVVGGSVVPSICREGGDSRWEDSELDTSEHGEEVGGGDTSHVLVVYVHGRAFTRAFAGVSIALFREQGSGAVA